MIDPKSRISIGRQCELLDLARSTFYYTPARETEENLMYMKLIDSQYMKSPFYGSRRMAICLKSLGCNVNRKRVQRLMRIMGLEALYPKPRLSQASKDHAVYPYLLRNVEINRVDQVWSTDITYVPMEMGFMFLVAVIDWYSRYVLSWKVSNTLDVGFCIEALEEALSYGKPEIVNVYSPLKKRDCRGHFVQYRPRDTVYQPELYEKA
jgi:putative transposase